MHGYLPLAALILFVAMPALADDAIMTPTHDGMAPPMAAMKMEASPAASASTRAFIDAGDRMHENMMIDYSGDTDADFARGMIPHHQGAIDMAKVELQYGSDPQLKALAQAIIKAQTDEIALMQAWLKQHGKQ